MKQWINISLVIMLLFTFVPMANAKVAGNEDGKASKDKSVFLKGKPDNGKPDKEKPGKGKPDKEKEKKAKASGEISALDQSAGKLTVDANGASIELVVNADTKLKFSGWKHPAYADIWVGDKVQVDYVITENLNTAKSIHVFKQKGTINGKVEAVDTTNATVTVSGKTVTFTDKTDIRLGKEKLTVADLVEGDQISATGYIKEGELQAYVVKVKRTSATVKGEVTSVDAAKKEIVLDDTSIVVADDAKIRINGLEATLEEIQPGDKIVATGQKQNNIFTAKIVNAQREAVELEGTIETIDTAAATITVSGKVLAVLADTKIVRDDETVALADLQVGDEVEVKAMQKGETEWVALKIEVKKGEDEDSDEQKAEIEGKIEAIDAAAMLITVNGKSVQVTSDTKIEAGDGKLITFADLAVGIEIEAEGIWQENVLNANKIKADTE